MGPRALCHAPLAGPMLLQALQTSMLTLVKDLRPFFPPGQCLSMLPRWLAVIVLPSSRIKLLPKASAPWQALRERCIVK